MLPVFDFARPDLEVYASLVTRMANDKITATAVAVGRPE